MKTKIILEAETERDVDGYERTTGVYELLGTVLLISVNTLGFEQGLEMRKGAMADMPRLKNTNRKIEMDVEHYVRANTKRFYADKIEVIPDNFQNRCETMFRERVAEVLSAAGVSAHTRMSYIKRKRN
ncbi:hypothetical protein [Roseovarius sp. D22-M7]|uniref:hypothetical protein n=1 Tax=Roseovarius sp. D22-M7 TaxID=3127116 RepID=UPI00301007D8